MGRRGKRRSPWTGLLKGNLSSNGGIEQQRFSLLEGFYRRIIDPYYQITHLNVVVVVAVNGGFWVILVRTLIPVADNTLYATK